MNFEHPGKILEHIEKRFNHPRIVIVGDLMLDRQIFGDIHRISPEAPIPVLQYRRQTETMGGAGNVARNLASLGAAVQLAAVTGSDADGATLLRLVETDGIRTDMLLRSPDRPTTVKTRYIGGHQHVLRMDNEVTADLTAEENRILTDRLGQAISGGQVDAIVLSDYNKGVLAPGLCQAVIGLARQQGIPVFVDPKGRNMLKYRGATAITPNRGEFQELCASLGIPTSDFIAAAREAIRRLELHYLVVTRSEDGMILIGPDAVLEVPASAREVFDVTGAGDTAIAVLAIGVASGLPVRDVLTLANGACGVVVGKVGTSAIELAELERLVAGEPSFMSEKICSLEEARARVKAWQEAGESVVFTNGCFDILHAGHVSYLEKARREGARLVLGLNSDASVRRLKGPSRPVNAEGDRALVLAALQSIDAVVLFGEDTPLELILALRPDVLAKGADYELDQIVGAPEVQSWGGRVARVELLAGRSTTAVLKKLQQ